MSMKVEIERVERVLSEVGCTVKALCDAAEINQSTWTRWKAGSNGPTMATWARVEAALADMTQRGVAA